MLASGVARDQCSIVVNQKDFDASKAEHAETGALSGFANGAALGGVLGAVAGGLLLGIAAAPLAVAGASAIFGGFAGALGGTGHPEPLLERLAQQVAEGKVLLIAEAPDLESQARAHAAMQAHGGTVEDSPTA